MNPEFDHPIEVFLTWCVVIALVFGGAKFFTWLRGKWREMDLGTVNPERWRR